MPYNTDAIRALLNAVFDDEELRIFCYDHFRQVYDKFSSEMSRLWKIQLLIDFCERRDQFDKLLTRIKEKNPQQYDKFISSIKESSQIQKVRTSSGRRQIKIELKGDISTFTTELRNALVGALAGALNIPRDQIVVLEVQRGTIILVVEMSKEAVDKLIILYEADDTIVRDLGIQHVTIIRKQIASPVSPNKAQDFYPETSKAALLLDRYKTIDILGRGGWGSVYLAEDTRFRSRKVAIKHLRLELAKDKIALKRFQNEAEIIVAINHPNIVTIYDRVDDDRNYYTIMEYAKSGTLKDLIIEEKLLPILRIVDLAVDLCRALSAVHAKDIIHRDIKPSNILLFEDAEGRIIPKLADFGVAQVPLAEQEEQLTKTGFILGTEAYMAPEQAQGKKVDARSDIYAMGVLLYEMLIGQPPYTGTPFNVLSAKMEDDPIPPKKRRKDIPDALDRLVMKAMSRDVVNRFQTAREMVIALQAIKEEASNEQNSTSTFYQSLERRLRRLQAEFYIQRQKKPFGMTWKWVGTVLGIVFTITLAIFANQFANIGDIMLGILGFNSTVTSIPATMTPTPTTIVSTPTSVSIATIIQTIPDIDKIEIYLDSKQYDLEGLPNLTGNQKVELEVSVTDTNGKRYASDELVCTWRVNPLGAGGIGNTDFCKTFYIPSLEYSSQTVTVKVEGLGQQFNPSELSLRFNIIE